MGTKLKRFWNSLGPGIITGAVDDDPGGLAAYSIAGAQFGLAQVWMMLYTLPFMIAVQRMCARIGALSGCGLAANIKRHYPGWVLAIAAISLLSANVFNVGADMYGMAGAVNLIIPVNIQVMAVVMAVAMMAMVITLRYRQIEAIFKWFAFSLFVYVIALVLVHPDWSAIAWHTLLPTWQPGKEFFIATFAILGTTISPYLFFWQASEEAEDVNLDHPRRRICKFRMVNPATLQKVDLDTTIGMSFSNLISFCIIALAASTIFKSGGGNIATLRDAAVALRPLAGNYAFGLFALGIISSGLLAIPVLAGSAAYVISEMMGWPASLDKPFRRAPQFYAVMIAAVAIGAFLPFVGISPIQALWWSAILNGLIAPILIMLIVHMSHNPAIVGPERVSVPVYLLGLGALFLMLTGTLVVIFS